MKEAGYSAIIKKRGNRLVTTAIGATILLIILFAVYQVGAWHRTTQRQAQQAATEQLSHKIDHFLVNHLVDVSRALAQTKEIRDLALGRTTADNPEVLIVLKATTKIFSSFNASFAYVMDENGTVIASTPYGKNKTLTGRNYKFRPYFIEAMQGKDTVYAALGVTTHKRGLYFGSPIYGENGAAPLAVVVLKVGLNKIDNLLNEYDYPVAMLSPDGIVFAANQPDWLFHAAFPISPEKLDLLRESKQFADSPLLPLPVMLDKDQVRIDNTPRTIAFKPLMIPGWRIATLRDTASGYPVAIAVVVISGLMFTAFFVARFLVVSQHKKIMTEEIKESSTFLSNVLESLTFPFYVIDAGDYTIQLTNSAATATGALPEKATCYAITHHNNAPCDTSKHPCPLDEVKKTGQPVIVEHSHYIEGQARDVEVHGFPIFDKAGNVVQMIEFCLDITEKKRAEEALREREKTLRTITDTAKDAIIMVDNRGKISFWNPGAEEIFGYPAKEAIDREVHSLLAPQQYHDSFKKGFHRFTETGEGPVIGRTVELEAIRKDATEFPMEISLSSIRTKGRWHAVGIARDITERKQIAEELLQHKKHLEERVKKRTEELAQANEQLQQENIERKRAEEQLKILLKEIHHRVKNNMQVISSLLKLQSRYIKDKKSVQVLQESQSRIRAMALIHEKIYRSQDLAKIKFSGYIMDLTASLFSFYKEDKSHISFHIDAGVDDVFLDIDTAIPCGLIINELVTNSLKYAFPQDKGGEIRILFRKTGEDELSLTVSDNGVGMPVDIDFRETESLGLHLVTMLAEDQLDGKITLDRTSGTEFQIQFRRKT